MACPAGKSSIPSAGGPLGGEAPSIGCHPYCDQSADRDRFASWDDQIISAAGARGRGLDQFSGSFGNRADVWGGALQRTTSGPLVPARLAGSASSSPGRRDSGAALVSGPRRYDHRYVPIGFDRYHSDTVNPGDYLFYQMPNYRIAIPRSLSRENAALVLGRIYEQGPRAAGYVRMGDTLVPAILGPGDRHTLAGVGFLPGPPY